VKAIIEVRVVCPCCQNILRQRKDIIFCVERSCVQFNVQYKAPTVDLEAL